MFILERHISIGEMVIYLYISHQFIYIYLQYPLELTSLLCLNSIVLLFPICIPYGYAPARETLHSLTDGVFLRQYWLLPHLYSDINI